MTRFREHRGQLIDSLATTISVSSLAELKEHCARMLSVYAMDKMDKMTVKPYGYDERIQWDTHIVELPGYGVLGFTDGPLE